MSENITVSRVIPARPERIFNAWLDPEEHGKMIGSLATAESDGRFTAWDGYIEGRTLETDEPRKIVQSWRTTEFPEGAPDSRLTVALEAADGGTKVTLTHENIPDGQGASYESGWQEHYFEPMTRYFSSPGSRVKEVGEVLEHALEQAEQQVEAVAEDAMKAVDSARKKAQKQAVKAVRAVKKVQKQAAARARAVGQKVKALVQRKKKKPAARKAAKKASKAKRPAAKKPAPKKKPARKGGRARK
ncbi:MAG: SRPBCC domain-containing protein [Myxococcota bacterium]